ncbi:MAG: TonB-dependent receptor [Pseudomonadales bacterium]
MVSIIKRNQKIIGKTVLAIAVAASTASFANAQDTGESVKLEEVVVTARKVQESMQDIPIAMSAFSGDFVKDLNLRSIDETLAYVPGATMISSSPGEQTFSIRGISSGAEGAGSDSGVLVMVDNEVISRDFMRSAAMYDVQRVEVLRGPQGTTYGRNATAGVMHVLNNTPTGENSASLTAEVGNYNRRRIDGYINGSLNDTETVKGRLSLHGYERDGYTEDAITGDDLDGWEEFALRAQLLFEPSDELSILFRSHWSKEEANNPAPRKAYDPSLSDDFAFDPHAAPYTELSADPWKVENSDDLFYERDVKGLSAELHWDLDRLNFTSLTTYRDADDKVRVDLFGTPRDMVVQNSENDATTWSQEFRLDNAGSDTNLHWLAGLFYLNEQHDRDEVKDILVDVISVDDTGFAGQPGFDYTSWQYFTQSNETDSFGVFGELVYSFGEKTDLTVGGRYSKDEKSYQVYHTAGGALAGLLIDEDEVEASVEDSWSAATGRVSLTHKITDTSMLYASYSTGYKSGGFNPEPNNEEAAVTPFDEETVASFEIGAKTELFDDTLRLNVTLFDSDYDDIQIENHKPSGATIIANVAEASIKGIELEYTWLATDHFTLTGSYANYDAEYGSYVNEEEGDDFSGNPIANVPKWTANVSAIYSIPLGDNSLALRLDYTDRSDIHDDPDPEAYQSLRAAEEMIHARATWSSAADNWQVSLWGKNLANNAEMVNISPQSIMQQRHVVYAAPRTYGVSVTYNWQ